VPYVGSGSNYTLVLLSGNSSIKILVLYVLRDILRSKAVVGTHQTYIQI
jgi:hypothetical protein